MKALTLNGSHSIRYEDVPDPAIERDTDAIVRVSLAGLCGSDLHPWHGRESVDAGTVMGHEFVGEVVEVGRAVQDLTVGQVVASPFSTSCGRCFYCMNDLPSRCVHGALFGYIESGAGLNGGQAEFVRVPHADGTLVPLPEGVSEEQALLLGDIFSTGWFGCDMARVGPGRALAVIGLGPVGIMTVIAALEMGAETIFAVDTVPKRLAAARELGAIPVDFNAESPAEVIRAATGGRGADAVMEAVGSQSAEEMSLRVVRPGGHISAVGCHYHPFTFSPAEAYTLNLTYSTGRCPARHYMEKLAPVVRESKRDITRVISHRLPLRDGPAAYRMFDGKEDGCTKVVFEL